MNAGYYLSLYGRNVWGVLRNGFNFGLNAGYLAGFVWLGALALLPLTLTFGAGIKTIIDCYNREYTQDKTVLNSIPNSVKNMNEENIMLLCNQALQQEQESAPFSRSNSSAKLFKQLSAYKDQQTKEEITAKQNKYIQLVLKQLHPGANDTQLNNYIIQHGYTRKKLLSITLDDKTELENFKMDHSQLPCSNQLKSDIARYMGEERIMVKIISTYRSIFSPKRLCHRLQQKPIG